MRGIDGTLAPASWDEALDRAATLLRAAGAGTVGLAGGRALNEEGYLLQRLVRDQRGSPHLESRTAVGPSRELLLALHAPELQATVPDLEFAHHVLLLDVEPVEAAPILEMRLRKGARRLGTALSIAGPRPSALDPRAGQVLRYAPGGSHGFLAALADALSGGDLAASAAAAGVDAAEVQALADALKAAGEDRVILYGEQLLQGADADESARALLRIAEALELGGSRDGAGLLRCPPRRTAVACARSACCRMLARVCVPSRRRPVASGLAEGLGDGSLGALLAVGTDPLADLQGRPAWRAALQRSSFIAVTSF